MRCYSDVITDDIVDTDDIVWGARNGQASVCWPVTRPMFQARIDKVLFKGLFNLANYTYKIGSSIRAGLEKKIDIQHEEKQICLLIRELTKLDAACYRLRHFNTSHEEDLKTICLRLYDETGITEGIMRAAVGNQTSLHCWLNEENVSAIWQKVTLGEVTNLARYSKKLGLELGVGLKQKFDFKFENGQIFSLAIGNVTKEDEGCYECLSITEHLPVLITSTYLNVYEELGLDHDVFTSSYPAGSVPGLVEMSDVGQSLRKPVIIIFAIMAGLSLGYFSFLNFRKVITAIRNLLGMPENKLPENGEQNV